MITKDALINWLGSDNLGQNNLLVLILELVNGEYDIPQLQADIQECEVE